MGLESPTVEESTSAALVTRRCLPFRFGMGMDSVIVMGGGWLLRRRWMCLMRLRAVSRVDFRWQDSNL